MWRAILPYVRLVVLAVTSTLPSEVLATSIDKSPRQTHILNSGDMFLALESWDRVGLYDITTGKKRRTFCVSTPYVETFALSADERTLAVVGREGLSVFDFRTAKVAFTVRGASAFGVSVTQDGKLVATASYKAGVHVYESPGGRLVAHIDRSDVWDVALSPDGGSGALVGLDQRVRVFDLPTGRMTGTVVPGHGPIAYSRHGKRLAVSSPERLRVLDTATLTLKDYEWFTGISTLRATEDGFIIVRGSYGTFEGHFLANSSTTIEKVWTLDQYAAGADFLPQGQSAVLTNWGVETTVFDIKTGSTSVSLQGIYGAVDHVSPADSPFGHVVAVIVVSVLVVLTTLVLVRRMRRRCVNLPR